MNLEDHPFFLQLKTCQIYYMNQSKMKSKVNKKEALLGMHSIDIILSGAELRSVSF